MSSMMWFVAVFALLLEYCRLSWVFLQPLDWYALFFFSCYVTSFHAWEYFLGGRLLACGKQSDSLWDT
jgi:hypothetical protein